MRYLKAVVFSLSAWLSLRKEIEKNKLNHRTAIVKDLEGGLVLFFDAVKSWLIRCIRHPVISILSDPHINFNFMDSQCDSYER